MRITLSLHQMPQNFGVATHQLLELQALEVVFILLHPNQLKIMLLLFLCEVFTK